MKREDRGRGPGTDSANTEARGRAALVVVFFLAFVLAACQTTSQPRGTPETSGFLGDYSMLKPGEGDQAGLVYIASDANLARYDAVMLDSVTFWRSQQTEKLSDEERQALTDSLYEAVHRELAKDYRVVDRPGPGVMRIRLAITDAKGAHVVANTVTSVIPQLRLLTTLGGMAADARALVGGATIEVEISDSLSGRRLVAAVDERWGTKTIRGGILEWSQVKEAFDYWGKRLRERLAEERGSP